MIIDRLERLEAALVLLVISGAVYYRESPINLFCQNDSEQLVWEGDFSERNHFVGALKNRLADAVATADDKGNTAFDVGGRFQQFRNVE